MRKYIALTLLFILLCVLLAALLWLQQSNAAGGQAITNLLNGR